MRRLLPARFLAWSWKKRIGVVLASGFLFFVALFGIAYAMTSVPEPNSFAIKQSTRVLYADGKEMGKIGTNRQIVGIDKISTAAQHAVLAAEDREFYNEPGISPKGILRALFSNVQAGGVSQGGSTITQQYAKNAFLTQDRTYSRKVKEVFIALKMSRTVKKDKVLEDYLNTIYFGRGAYGIEAAAQTYFGSRTHASNLTAAQAAVLASSIKSPSLLDPTKHPERAKERWNYVLDGMVAKGWLSKADRDAATYPSLQPIPKSAFQGSLEHVRQQVLEDLARHGFPEDRITAGGLVVKTTINSNAQAAAQQEVEKRVPGTGTGKHPVAALVSVEPGTGKVLAYYGGASAGGFDYADDGKGVQPGSSMKPYVLAAALEKGTSVDTTLDGSDPQTICGTEISNDQGDPNFGKIDLATALQYSVNTVYYRLACDTGAQRVADTAHAAGIPDSQPLEDPKLKKPTSQIALGAGGYEIHPLDQATGYATFAAKGTRARAYFVQSVTDTKGNEIYAAKPDTGSAFSEGVAADTVYAMQKVVTGGTGTRAQLDGRPTAGKTGTTGNNANAWFAGIVPQLSTTVWVGMSDGSRIEGLEGVTGGVYGGQVPAEVFKAYMERALEGTPVLQFPPKAGVGKSSGPASSGGPSTGPSATSTAGPTATPSTGVSLPPVLPTVQPTQQPTEQPTQQPSETPPPATSSPSPAQQQASPASSP